MNDFFEMEPALYKFALELIGRDDKPDQNEMEFWSRKTLGRSNLHLFCNKASISDCIKAQDRVQKGQKKEEPYKLEKEPKYYEPQEPEEPREPDYYKPIDLSGGKSSYIANRSGGRKWHRY